MIGANYLISIKRLRLQADIVQEERNEPTQGKNFTPNEAVLAVALELSKGRWKIRSAP